MLNRAHRLSSSLDLFAADCDNLKEIFLELKYPEGLINFTITRFNESQDQEQALDIQVNKPVRIIRPLKDQRSADFVRRQLSDLEKKINSDLRPVFTSKKTVDEIKVTKPKPPLIDEQWVVYEYKCGLCDADYVGYRIYSNKSRGAYLIFRATSAALIRRRRLFEGGAYLDIVPDKFTFSIFLFNGTLSIC